MSEALRRMSQGVQSGARRALYQLCEDPHTVTAWQTTPLGVTDGLHATADL